jgi:hypothetical protein
MNTKLLQIPTSLRFLRRLLEDPAAEIRRDARVRGKPAQLASRTCLPPSREVHKWQICVHCEHWQPNTTTRK